MAVVRGIGLALAIFVASFVLHIVGGATDQGWLFAIAVALIFVTATGFPVVALWLGEMRSVRSSQGRLTVAIGGAVGYCLTVGTLWAANGRAFAWWEFPLAIVLVGAMSLALLGIGRGWLILRGKDQPRRTPRVVTHSAAMSEADNLPETAGKA
jgi:hypothetical protein